MITSSVELKIILGKYLHRAWELEVDAKGGITVVVHPKEYNLIRNILKLKCNKGLFQQLQFKKFSLFQLILRRFS